MDMKNLHAHEPEFWFRQAEELDRAAHLIWQACETDFIAMSKLPVGSEVRRVNLGGTFWLNAGLAIENLLKGSIIQREPSLVVDGRINKSLKIHDLTKLARLADTELSPVEGFYLWVATECIIWAGRYPSSTNAKKTKPPVFSEADFLAYESLYKRFAPQRPSTASGTVYQRLI